jgi:putative endonuclease
MSRSSHAKTLGDLGEQKAVEYLLEQGFVILERNYRAGHGEIDIVAQEGEYLVFVEVKTCHSTSFGEPEAWVTPLKQKRMISAARKYRIHHQVWDADCRYDIIAFRFANDKMLINHIRDAFWVNEGNDY